MAESKIGLIEKSKRLINLRNAVVDLLGPVSRPDPLSDGASVAEGYIEAVEALRKCLPLVEHREVCEASAVDNYSAELRTLRLLVMQIRNALNAADR